MPPPQDPANSPLLVVDGHVDTAQRILDEPWHLSDAQGEGHLSLVTAREGGLSAAFFAIWPEPKPWRGRYAHRTLALIDAVLCEIERSPRDLRLCTSAADIRAAHGERRFGVLLGIEGGHAIVNDLALLRAYYRLGARYMTLTWSNTNEWADSSGDLDDPAIPHHGGLTSFGKQVVCEMNRLGMMVDVSHVSDATFAGVLATTQAPVIASHSSARTLTAAPRNLTDEMLRRLAGNGGLAMVNFFPAFIDEQWRAEWNAQRPERDAAHAQWLTHKPSATFIDTNQIDRAFAQRLERPPLSALIDHIDHMIHIAGVDHVGLGSDFDGIPALPEGIDSAADLPKIIAALEARGYHRDQLRPLLGGNLLRVFGAVERYAARAKMKSP